MYLGSNEQIFATGSDLHHRELLYRQLAKRGGRGFLWLLHAQQCRHDGIRSLIPSLFQTHTPSLFRRSVPLVQEAVQLVAACWHPSARGWSRRFPKMGCRLLPLKRLVLATRHIIYFFTRNSRVFPAEPSNNFFVYKATFLIKPCVRLCYDIVVLFIRSQIVSLVGDLACVWINAAVRCFNKAELIDFGIG